MCTFPHGDYLTPAVVLFEIDKADHIVKVPSVGHVQLIFSQIIRISKCIDSLPGYAAQTPYVYFLIFSVLSAYYYP